MTWLTVAEYLCYKWPRICSVVITVLFSFMIYNRLVTRITQRVPHVQKDYCCSIFRFMCVVNHRLSFCPFSFSHCIVCRSSMYGFWLPHCIVCRSSMYGSWLPHCIVCRSSMYGFWLPHCIVCRSSMYGFWLPHCIVCRSSMYGFWLPHRYFQSFLRPLLTNAYYKRHLSIVWI
jgi:hypothetical protein